MDSPRHGNHSSWAFVPKRNFPSGRDSGMTAFRRRLVEILGLASREEVEEMET
jgi:hypothetical protein